eukprot:TRINITY_DN12215_c0_g2_i1.p1 TRINITY_DN12215_c0_g2~~TRINITY_DN12215_c0_g2_i1.p1  ORF type:complete len:354 (-),score=55.56 TRINITY_DN12215_c0_g2_i1:40-1101(-)
MREEVCSPSSESTLLSPQQSLSVYSRTHHVDLDPVLHPLHQYMRKSSSSFETHTNAGCYGVYFPEILALSDLMVLACCFLQSIVLAYKLDHMDSWEAKWVTVLCPLWLCAVITTLLLGFTIFLLSSYLNRCRKLRVLALDPSCPSGVELIPMIAGKVSKTVVIWCLCSFGWLLSTYLDQGSFSLATVFTPLFVLELLGLIYSILVIDYAWIVSFVCLDLIAFQVEVILGRLTPGRKVFLMIPVLLLGVSLFLYNSFHFQGFLSVKLKKRTFSNAVNQTLHTLFLFSLSSFFFLSFVALLLVAEVYTGLANVTNFSSMFLSLEACFICLGLSVVMDARSKQKRRHKKAMSSSLQ